MNRRTFLTALAAAPAMTALRPGTAAPICRRRRSRASGSTVRPNLNPLFNQSNMVVTVETDIGITGIGEGGAKDTLEQCAGTLIGKNPFRIEAIWQEMYIAWFYPPGREKMHALGALDLALWDIKGKALGLPVHELLGGMARDYCECYATGGAVPPGTPADAPLSLKERARGDDGGRLSGVPHGRRRRADRRRLRHALGVRRVAQDCKEVREGVGPDGDWCIDFHQRFDLNDALRCCKAIEEYEPVLRRGSRCATSTRSMDIPKLRQMTHGAADPRRGVGPSGTSTSWSRTTTSTTSARRCRTSAASPR